VDNQQVISRCRLAPEVLSGHEGEFRLTRAIVRAKLPGCFHYLVTSFFEAPVIRPRTTLVPPILRNEVLSARPEDGGHLLVYQTSTSYGGLLDALRASGVECRVYGVRRGITADEREGNLHFRPFSDAGFVEDLRTARGVISNGGFTLLGEAVYLHRPVLSVPVGGQFEQVVNARYIAREGYGMAADEVTAQVLGAFLERTPEFSRHLARHTQDGNRALLGKLDALLAAATEEGTPWHDDADGAEED
jgi:uncharacterized protein (TIGR00661 family)